MPSQLFASGNEPQSIKMVAYEERGFQHRIEPELAATSVPRLARVSKNNISMRRVLWNVMFVIIGLMGFLWRRDYETWNALIACGITTDAEVYDKHSTSGKSTSYYLSYRFYTNAGSAVDGVRSVGHSTYDSTGIGDKIMLTYLPEPIVNKWQLDGATLERRDAQTWRWVWSTTAIAGCFGLGIWGTVATANYQTRLLQSGIAVQGRVTSGEVIRGKHVTYRLHYVYHVGEMPSTGYTDVTSAQYTAMTMGNPYFTVLYEASNPSKSTPYFKITEAYLPAASA